jgi:voltage-gated potassium channel
MDLLHAVLSHKLHRSFKPLFYSILYVLFVISIGVYGYMRLMSLPLLDAIYFTIVTLSTIGYGDVTPQTPEAKLFTIFFIPLGVSAFLYVFSAISMTIFEGRLLEVLKVEEFREKISKMKNHVILCGYGDVGSFITDEIKNIVVVEKSPENYSRLVKEGILGVEGDATKSETLREAGIDYASALVVALDSDSDAVFTILTAKELNKNIRIYARVNRRDSVSKMRHAGADYVICLPEVGGREIAKQLKEV